jgi:hypothetical protein
MMTFERLTSLIDAYGAEPERWPADERAAGLLLLANSAEARAYAHEAAALDALLDRVPLRPTVTVDPAALAARIVRAPARPAPKQPSFAVRWGFGFGWANIAALAAAGIVGFMVGWTDLTAVTTATTATANRDIVDMIAPAAALSSAAEEESVW